MVRFYPDMTALQVSRDSYSFIFGELVSTFASEMMSAVACILRKMRLHNRGWRDNFDTASQGAFFDRWPVAA